MRVFSAAHSQKHIHIHIHIRSMDTISIATDTLMQQLKKGLWIYACTIRKSQFVHFCVIIQKVVSLNFVQNVKKLTILNI